MKEEKKTVFDFFDNDLFVEANKNKEFSNEEKVAIIIRSVKTSLNAKFEILNRIALESSDELKEEINEWINLKHKQLEFVKNLKASDKVSCFTILEEHSFVMTFSSLECALKDSMPYYAGKILFTNNDTQKHIGRVYVKGISSYKEDEEINYLDAIANINIFKDKYNDSLPVDYTLPIYTHTVELEAPFKPFDFVHAPSFTDFTDYFVVADKCDPDVKKVMEESIENYEERIKKFGFWLKLNVPNYFLETNTYGGHNVKEGEVTQSYLHEWERCNLADIKVYSPYEITVGRQEYINEIKNQLSKKHFNIEGVY